MGKNYYKTLGVERNSTPEQIKKAYRAMAMKWHPDRNPDNKQEAEKQFKEIGEAYSVLRDDKKRKTYDQFGQDGLKNNFSGAHFTFGNAEDIFKQFFDGSNPFDFSFGPSSFVPSGFGPSSFGPSNFNFQQKPKKAATIKHPLKCSLEELYLGSKKSMKVTRRRLNADGHTTKQEEKILRIDVKSGWKAGTTITYEREGDEIPGVIPADIQFIVEEKKHNLYQREGNDLIIVKKITLKDALLGFNINIQTLDNRNLSIAINTIVHPQYVHTVRNEGMPISKTKGQRKGDLKIKFNITFPNSLNQQQKNAISQCL